MSLRKKLQLSNLFMLGMSIVIVVTAGFFGIRLLGSRYLDSLEDLVVKDRGLYSAQTLIFSYQESFGTDPAQAVQELEKELSLMNFGFLVRADEEEWFSNLSEAQEETMESLLPGDTKDYGALAFIRDQTTLVQEKFMKNGISWEITACRFPGSKGSVPYVSYLKKYLSTLILLVGVITLSAVFLTNLALTHWVSKSILGPLKKLQEGAGRIADGDLNFELPVAKEDEIGEVCQEFDSMRKRLREALKAQMEYESNRKELLAGISHDLRTPLTSIRGYTEGLVEGIANTEEKRQRYYRAILTRSGDMETLIDNLSSFTRLEREKLSFVLERKSVAAFLRRVMSDFEAEAEQKKVLFVPEFCEWDLEVNLDESQMKRVFVNLFENSIKYRTGSESVIRLRLEKSGGYARIEVSDDGPGVPDQELKRIFDSFYRGDQARTSPGEGSGLGLAIVKQIVEGHGGKIWAENRNGLTTVILLPTAEEETDV